jgi:hypothetical protein
VGATVVDLMVRLRGRRGRQDSERGRDAQLFAECRTTGWREDQYEIALERRNIGR